MKRLTLFLLFVCLASAQTSSFPGAIDGDAYFKVAANNVQTVLRSTISAGDTVITVGDSSKVQPHMLLTIGKEIVSVTAVNGNNLTIARGFDGSAAVPHAAGTPVYGFWTSWHHNAMRDAVAKLEAAVAGLGAGPTKLSDPGANGVVYRDSTGHTVPVTGNPADCVKVNGSSGGCGTVAMLNPSDFAFATQTPGGALTAGILNVVTLSPCPVGVAATNTQHALYISGGTGAAEAVTVSGGTCTSGAASGTVIFTPANSHSGAWTIQSATAGLQEAIYSASQIGPIVLKPTTYRIYGSVYVPKNVTIIGSGNGCGSSSTVTTASDGVVAFNVNTAAAIDFSNFCIMSDISAPTSGAGIVIDAPSTYANTISKIHHMQFYQLYDGVRTVNVTNFTIADNFFLDMRHYGVKIEATHNTDVGGNGVLNNGFLQSSAIGTAAMYQTSSGATTYANNKVNGYSYGIWVNASLPTGTSELVIHGNVIEGCRAGSIRLEGTASFPDVSIVANRLANYTAPNWIGIDIRDTANSFGAITSNVISGVQVSGNVGIEIVNATDYVVLGNTLHLLGVGIQVWAATANTEIGLQHIASTVTTPYSNLGSSTVRILSPVPMSYATMTGTPAANGSMVFCSDCNATCTAGSSTGRTCFRENGAWTH